MLAPVSLSSGQGMPTIRPGIVHRLDKGTTGVHPGRNIVSCPQVLSLWYGTHWPQNLSWLRSNRQVGRDHPIPHMPHAAVKRGVFHSGYLHARTGLRKKVECLTHAAGRDQAMPSRIKAGRIDWCFRSDGHCQGRFHPRWSLQTI